MPDITNARGLSIGRMSERSGVHVETIRYYERIGLIPAPDRTRGGNRVFGEAHLKRLYFIRQCRALGFGIDEIRTLLDMVDRQDFTCAEVHRLTVANLASVREKIAGLRRMERTLADMAARCDRGDVPDCPIIETLFDVS